MSETEENERIRTFYCLSDISPVKKCCDRYGIITETVQKQGDDKSTLVQRWKHMLRIGISTINPTHLFTDDQSKRGQLAHLVYRGVPLCMKREVWLFLMEKSGFKQIRVCKETSSDNELVKNKRGQSCTTKKKVHFQTSKGKETLANTSSSAVRTSTNSRNSGGKVFPPEKIATGQNNPKCSEKNHNQGGLITSEHSKVEILPNKNIKILAIDDNSIKEMTVTKSGSCHRKGPECLSVFEKKIPSKSSVESNISSNCFNYEQLRNSLSGYEYQIHVDVQRTFRNHILFYKEYSPKQCELFWCLVAYSNYNKNVGYCQGMSSFTALILQYFSEDEAFEILIFLLKDLQLLFDSKLTLLQDLLNMQRQLFISVIPEIFYILKNENVDMCLFLYSWYLTLFTRFNIELVLRIWDILSLHGPISILPIATGILSHFSQQIAQLKGETLIEFLNTIETRCFSSEEIEEIVKKIRFAIEECDISDMTRSLFMSHQK